MSNYNSYIGNLASDLQDSNMQNHLRSTIVDVSVNARNLREKLIDYEYKELIRLIYLTALGNRDRYLDGEILKKHRQGKLYHNNGNLFSWQSEIWKGNEI